MSVPQISNSVLQKTAAKFQLKMCSGQGQSLDCSVRRLESLITFLFQFIKLLPWEVEWDGGQKWLKPEPQESAA